LNRLSRVHERYRRQTDGRATAYSEREREFTFAKQSNSGRLVMAALRSRYGHYIFVRFLVSFLFLSFFRRLISAGADRIPAILPHIMWPWCDLESMSEMCCTRLTENTERKKSPKIRHLGTVV